jgi:prefoldin alpha subunit
MADEEQQPGGAATATTEGTSSTTISLDDLSLEQLDQLKQREEHRLNALSVRYQQLRSVSARLSASQSAVHELPKKNNTTDDNGVVVVPAVVEAFVPLTESVYVPAMHDPDSPLLVDLGTGYYVEKSHQETMEFLDRKIRLVDANSDNSTFAISSSSLGV